MEIDKRDLQAEKIKRMSWLSFSELNRHFSNPDSRILNLFTISAEQFTRDLDSIIDVLKKKSNQYGNIGELSTVYDSNPIKKRERPDLDNFMQKSERHKFKFHKIFKRFLNFVKCEIHPASKMNKVKIQSWRFSNFDVTKKFQVGNLYTIKPVSIIYHSTQQEYKYDKQIISEFCIEELNGNIKKLLVIDTIKNGKIKRKKFIDGENINRQYYNFEIRNHRLNRCLMKTFLFHQFNIHNTPKNAQESIHIHYKTELRSAVAQPITDVICQNRDVVFSTPRQNGKFPSEYIINPLFAK